MRVFQWIKGTLVDKFEKGRVYVIELPITVACLCIHEPGQKDKAFRMAIITPITACHFSEFLKNKEVVMHLEHRAAEMVIVDFAGKKLCYTDPDSEEVVACRVFVSVLPYSGLIFCYAVQSQTIGDFIHCINQMPQYYGGAPFTILTDNHNTNLTYFTNK